MSRGLARHLLISRGLARHPIHTNIQCPLHTSYSVYVQHPQQHLTHILLIKSYTTPTELPYSKIQNTKLKNIFFIFVAGAFAHFLLLGPTAPHVPPF